MVNRLKSTSASLLFFLVACTGGAVPSGDATADAGSVALQSSPETLPIELRMVVAPVGDELLVALRNEGPGTARVPAMLNLYSPFRTVSLEVAPLPEGATTHLASNGFVMPSSQFDANVDIPPKRLYGSMYSIKRLRESMRLPSGCYKLTARYVESSGVKNAPAGVAPSPPIEVCF